MKPRTLARTIAAVAAVTLLASTFALFTRIRDFNRENPSPVFLMQEAGYEEFTFAGRDVTIIPDINDDGEGSITVTYGDEDLVLPVAIPSKLDLPGMTRFGDWLRVLRFVEANPGESTETVAQEVESGQRPERLVVVTRTPTPAENNGALGVKLEEGDWGFGEVLRKQWVFGFHELLPAGGFSSESLRFPTTKYYEPPIEGELRQGTWQYDAAFRVMPTGSAPKHNFTEAALVTAGWRLGVAGASALILTIALLASFAPSRANAVPGQPASDAKREEAERLLRARRTKTA